MKIADILVRPAQSKDEGDGVVGDVDSYLTVNDPMNPTALPSLGMVQAIYEVRIGYPTPTTPFDHRLVLQLASPRWSATAARAVLARFGVNRAHFSRNGYFRA